MDYDTNMLFVTGEETPHKNVSLAKQKVKVVPLKKGRHDKMMLEAIRSFSMCIDSVFFYYYDIKSPQKIEVIFFVIYSSSCSSKGEGGGSNAQKRLVSFKSSGTFLLSHIKLLLIL